MTLWVQNVVHFPGKAATLHETNSKSFLNMPQKEVNLPTIDFKGRELLVSGKVCMYTLATDVDRKVLSNMTQNICPKTVSLQTKIAVTFIYNFIIPQSYCW